MSYEPWHRRSFPPQRYLNWTKKRRGRVYGHLTDPVFRGIRLPDRHRKSAHSRSLRRIFTLHSAADSAQRTCSGMEVPMMEFVAKFTRR